MKIKLKVWHKKEKRFVEPEHWPHGNLSELSYWAINKDDDLKYAFEEDYEIILWTGLKDCKGKEIYEGDIIKTYDGDRPYIVTFGTEVGFVGWYAQYDDWEKYYELNSEDDFYEVIGNKFEDAHKLKAEGKEE